MANKKSITTQMINRHRAELAPIFQDIPQGPQRIVVDRMLDQCAFLLAQADECQRQLQDHGSIELFKNGAQEMLRENPASKIHNNVSKQILSYLEKMYKMIPAGSGQKNELEAFMDRKKQRAVK